MPVYAILVLVYKYIYHIKAEIEWPSFGRWHLKRIILIRIKLEYVSKSSIED